MVEKRLKISLDLRSEKHRLVQILHLFVKKIRIFQGIQNQSSDILFSIVCRDINLSLDVRIHMFRRLLSAW